MLATYDLQITMPPLHENQVAIRDAGVRFVTVAAGRRFGKTKLGASLAVYEAAMGGRAWWVAPSYKVGKIGWRMIVALSRQIPGVQIWKGEMRIEFPGGGFVEVRTAQNPELLRGEGLTLCILDEASFMLETVWLDIIQPALGERQGRALFISTPNGRNWFWSMFMRGLDDPRGLYKSYQFSTLDNPFFPPEEFERLRDDMPEDTFAQEHLAQFIDDAGLVFRRVRAQVLRDIQPVPDPRSTYVFGIDWGRYHDFTVVAVLDVQRSTIVAVDRFNRVSWQLQRDRIISLYQRWKPTTILAESNSIGDVNIEALQQAGLPVRGFETTTASKSMIIEALALALENEQLWLLPDEQLINELIAYTMERRGDGTWKYSAPAGFFDDMVIATALSWYAGKRYSGTGIW